MAEHDDSHPLVRLGGASVTRGAAVLLHGVDFQLRAGARLAVLGDNGAGKTTFLRLLRGELPPDPGGQRVYDLPAPFGQGGPQDSPLGLRQRLALVSGDMQDLYALNDWAATGLEAVLSGFADSLLLYAEPTQAQRAQALAVMADLGLKHLADRRMSRLSTGQARSVLLARALACRPDALLLDECLEGLDAPSRREFLVILDDAAKAEPRLALLFSSHRTDELPSCLTEALVLQSGRILTRGPLGEVLAARERQAAPLGARPAVGSLTRLGDPADDARLQGVAAGAERPRPLPVDGGFLVRITNADVVVGGAAILHGINWTIREGEHWAVLGHNGAGKSTLLGLLAGAFWPSALCGPPGLVEYGFARPGEPLDEVRRRVGRVAASLDREYSVDLRVEQAVWSGAFGSIGLFAQADQGVRTRGQELMDFFGVAELAGRRIRSLSRGQLRRVLLARALLGHGGQNPALLLLDEPMAGLDARGRKQTRELLARLAQMGVPVVMVTHHERDLPEQVHQVLALEDGRVVFCGERAEFLAPKKAARA